MSQEDQQIRARSQEGTINLPLQGIIPYLLCGICKGYLVDAISLLDCNHSFCRSCFLEYIKKKEDCPMCGNFLSRNKLETCYKNDGLLQTMVYKLIPALQMAEERDRKGLYEKLHASPANLQVLMQRLIAAGRLDERTELLPLSDPRFGLSPQLCAPNDPISFGFEFPVPDGYLKNGGMKAHDVRVESFLRTREGIMVNSTRCFLTTHAKARMSTLKKFLMAKYSLFPPTDIEIVYGGEILREDYSLGDIVQIFLGGVKKYIHFYFQAVSPCDPVSMMPELMPEMIPAKIPKLEVTKKSR